MPATMNAGATSLMTMGNPHQSCIDACLKCVQICEECFSMCLQEQDVKERANCIKTLQDCAEICSVSARFMSRESGSAKGVCDVCASICEKCAIECGMFEDEHCQTCASTCSQCATECRSMVAKQ